MYSFWSALRGIQWRKEKFLYRLNEILQNNAADFFEFKIRKIATDLQNVSFLYFINQLSY